MLKLVEKEYTKKALAVLAYVRKGQNPVNINRQRTQGQGKEKRHKDKKLKKNKASTSGTSGYQKLNKGALDLYVGNGNSAATKAIGSFDLILLSVMILVLDNFFKDNVFYFNVILRDGIFEIDMHNHISNERSIYTCSNKKPKHNLDSTFLWHYRLGYINKKHIEKLQHDGLLKSIDDESFDVCISCISGKMARKPFTHASERADDLLGIIHSDVCGPFRTTSREESAALIFNMVPTKKVNKTPYEMWHRKVQNLSYLKVWGCEALVKRDMPKKLESISIKCIFIGYPNETMGYYFYYPLENKFFVARYAEFFETSLITQEASGSTADFDKIQKEDAQPSENTSQHQHEVKHDTQTDVIPVRRSERIPQAPERYGFYIDVEEHELGDHGEHPNYQIALSDPESKKWFEAMNAEMQSIKDIQVWNLVDLPPNYIKAIRILIAITAYYDYEIWKMDVKTAFLNGRLNKDIYMVQPEGSLNKRFDEEIKKYGFTQNLNEPCVYKRASGSIIVFLILYVDDILLMGNNIPMLQDVKSWLGKCFTMKDLGEATYILGIKIYRDRLRRLIGLSQNAYIDKILKRFKMDTSKRGTIPMQPNVDLSKSQGPSTSAENLTSRYQQNPGESHWTAVKNILNWETNRDDLRSQTGFVFMMNGGAVDLKSSKQRTTAMSSMEA
ncbi:retrotransposon protein, putative, ty1-copia subclass [Tanacetum coccineum]